MSHLGLAEGLRALEKTQMDVRTQAQPSTSGRRKLSGKALKDVTNRLDPKPIIGKVARIITKGVTGHKRPNEVLRREEPNGPPNKSLFEKTTATKFSESGLGKGRPPDPPNLKNPVNTTRTLSPIVLNLIWGREGWGRRRPGQIKSRMMYRWRIDHRKVGR